VTRPEHARHPARSPLLRRAKRSLQRQIVWGMFAAIAATGLTIAVAGRTPGAIVVAVLVLWIAAAALARRLARPIGALAEVAERLGRGELSARFALDACRPERRGESRAPAEVVVLGEAFNTMAERIETQMRDQKALLAQVSHELRTPLARIRLLTELARDATAPTTQLDDIDREVEELDALVGALLAEARIDFALVERTRIDATELAQRALERAGLEATLLRAETGEFGVDADPTLLGRALANLLDNARVHGEGVTALVVSRDAGGEVALVVEDHGPGLPAGDPRGLFEPFTRRARGAERGSLGLGLALVRRVAEVHGGHVVAEPRDGGGARLGLRLPAAAR
jgi:two-component system OmpR family sensor kinase